MMPKFLAARYARSQPKMAKGLHRVIGIQTRPPHELRVGFGVLAVSTICFVSLGRVHGKTGIRYPAVAFSFSGSQWAISYLSATSLSTG
eukprot:910204-Rhodomonas_salina.2